MKKLVFLLSLGLMLKATCVSAHVQVDVDEKLRSQTLNMLYASKKLSSDSLHLDYVNEIGERIQSRNGIFPKIKFYVMDDDEINAFATPGGVIVVNTGLIERAKSEDELAAVIAHELAHLTQSHFSRREDDNAMNGADIALMGASIIAGVANPDIGMAGYAALTAQKTDAYLRHSRGYEYEADNLGIQYLQRSGYNPRAMADFFGELQEAYRNHPSIPEFLMTHPVTSDRLANAWSRAENYGAGQEEGIVHQRELADNYAEYLTKTPSELELEMELYPSRLTPILAYLDSQFDISDMSSVEKIVLSHIETHPYPELIYRKLAEIYGRRGELDRAHYYNAMEAKVSGQSELYAAHLKQSKAHSKDKRLLADINIALSTLN